MDGVEDVEVSLEMMFQNQRERFSHTVKNENYDGSFNEMNLISNNAKNGSRSLRTSQNFYRRESMA
jgi:hypothetical protein